MRRIAQNLLAEIKTNATYYRNIYHFASAEIRAKINHALFLEMQKLLFNSDLSNKHIQSISGLIFIRISDWISHDFQDSIINVYTDVECLFLHHL